MTMLPPAVMPGVAAVPRCQTTPVPSRSFEDAFGNAPQSGSAEPLVPACVADQTEPSSNTLAPTLYAVLACQATPSGEASVCSGGAVNVPSGTRAKSTSNACRPVLLYGTSVRVGSTRVRSNVYVTSIGVPAAVKYAAGSRNTTMFGLRK